MAKLHYDFDGDVAVVTGAASGIGLEILNALARSGARVHGFDVERPETVESGPGGEPVFHRVDLRDDGEIRAAVEAVLEAEGRIDLLVNNAGITRDGVLWKMEDADWEDVLAVNLSGAWRVLRAIAPHMRDRERGRVVQIASVNGLRGKFGQSNYAASKAGLIGMTRAAARELGPRGITVNAVAPGMIDTPMAAAIPAEVVQRAVDESALGRLGRPADVAGAVLFLLSDEAAHVTGVVLRVDGGQLS